VAEEIRWNGREAELAYDKKHVHVARLAPGCGPELREKLAAMGWRHASTDCEQAELWVAMTDELAGARLDRVVARAAGVEQSTPSLF
jgi:hypothetical protein